MRGFTRGGFLKAGGAALASVGSASVAGSAAGAGSERDPLAHLRRKTYEPLLNETFRLDHPHRPLDVELVEVKQLAAPTRGESFSVLFETRQGARVDQGSYTLRHPAMGSFSLFLVPVGKGEKGYFVEAVVNRLSTE